MRHHRIRRLPVEGFGGTVAGIVSMNDLLLAAGRGRALRNEAIVDTLQAISAHQPIAHVTAA